MKKLTPYITLLLAAALPQLCSADLVGPYTPDANTLYLVHLDESVGGSVAANTGGKGGVFITSTNTTSGNGLASLPSVTTLLGNPSFSGFNTAVSGTNVDGLADAVIGFDGNNNGVYDGDVQGGQASPDGIAMTNLNIGVGGASPFTLEAIIRPSDKASNQEIICSDSYHVRGFQFKITSAGQLQFQYITAPTVNLTVAIPTTGINAFVPDAWYHVAVTYDGSTLRLYWTKLDSSISAANQISSTTWAATTANGAVVAPLVIGGENRGSQQEAFKGLIDEVRISNVARGPGDMQFYSPAVTISKDPAGQNIDYGQPVTFTVSASSLTDMGYQWRLNQTPIPDATNSSFSIPSVVATDAGDYDVVITNTAGYSATSAAATLVVGAAHFLAHRWSFASDLSDSIGGATGTAEGNAVVAGGSLVLDGTSNTFVSLPAHLLSGLSAVTFDFWASPGTNGANCRIFDFGNTNFVSVVVPPPENYVFFSPHTGGSGHNLGISGGSSEFQQNATGSGNFDSQTVHVTCVVDPPNKFMAVYTNGVLEVANTNLSVSLASLDDQLCWLGRSLFAADAWLNGSIDEFRIYDGALSPASLQQSQLLGPDQVLGDGPVEMVVSPTNTTVVNGRLATFSVGANGHLPIQYQWYKNNSPVDGGTNSVLTFTVTPADDGATFLVWATNTVSNVVYSAVSSQATLQVLQPPTLVWVGNGSGDWDYSTPNNWSNTVNMTDETFSQYDGAIFDSRGSSQSAVNLTQAIDASGGVTVNSSSDYTFTSSSQDAVLGGQGALLKQGTGKLTWAVTDTMTGPTFIQGGTLQIGNNDTVGSLGSGPITNNGVLSLSRSDTLIVPNAIHGTGSLSLDYGSATIQGSNDFSGVTLVNSGILNLQNGAGLGTAAGGTTIAGGAEIYLTVNASVADALTLSGAGDGNGALRKGGGGYSAWTGPVTMSGDTSFGVDGGATLDLSNVVSGAYALSVLGSSSGTLALSANNTYSGGTSLADPIVNLNAQGALGTGPVTANGAGRFLIASGLNITNHIIVYQVNPGAAHGFFMVNDNTNDTVTTVSGPIEFYATAASGGHFIGPFSSGWLNVTGPITMNYGDALVVRDGRVRFANANSTFSFIQVRANTTSIGMNNGLGTSVVMDLAGNGSAVFDLNGYNQTLLGLQNEVTPANAGLGVITNSSATPSTLTLDLGNGYAYSSGSRLAGNLSLVLQSGIQTLSGTNSYSGNTTINSGTLDLLTPTLAAASTVSVANGGMLQLDFTETNQVAGLVFGGVSQGPGVYNSSSSPSYISGAGSLKVVPGPSGPAYLTNSISGSTLTLSWPAGQNWRLQMQTNSLSKGLGTNWVDVTPGAATSTNITINPNQPAVFYRLKYP